MYVWLHPLSILFALARCYSVYLVCVSGFPKWRRDSRSPAFDSSGWCVVYGGGGCRTRTHTPFIAQERLPSGIEIVNITTHMHARTRFSPLYWRKPSFSLVAARLVYGASCAVIVKQCRTLLFYVTNERPLNKYK